MARELKVLAVLWLAAACVIIGGASAGADTTTAAPPPTPVETTTTAAPPPTPVKTTTTAAPPPTPVKTTTTAAPPPTPVETTTTAAPPPTPVKTTTTAAPPPTPVETTTTAAPPPTPVKTTTTAAPPPTPVKTTTTAAPPPTPVKTTTTAAPPPTPVETTTTAAPPPTPVETTSDKDPSTSQQEPTTSTPDPCQEGLCGDGSTCVPLADQTYECLCLAGDYYNNNTKNCENAKVFPGHLLLPGMKYKNHMNDTMSTEFLKASREIKNELNHILEGVLGYETTMVVELRPLTNDKVWEMPDVNATVEIIFKASSDVTVTEIEEQIKNASECDDCLLAMATFDETNLCDKKPCDNRTTECSSGNGSYTCTCLKNYLETDFSNRLCVACPSGQKIQGSRCVKCSFGYTGLNCSESWQLALVIVSSVLGGLLLITLILLPIVGRKSSKKKSKKSKHADTWDQDIRHFSDKTPLTNGSFAKSQAAPVNGSANGPAAFANSGVPRIPRATANSSWDRRTNIELTPSNSRQNLGLAGRNARLYDDHDYLNSFDASQPQSSLYAQVQPQINARSRPQINPYAPNQGHTNLYYTNDDGQRYNY